MKKILSLVLALLMSVSAASFVGAADAAIADETTATSTEAEVQAQYADALSLLVNWGIYKGQSKDDLAASQLIKRYEMALFVSRVSTGWTDDSKWAVADQWYDRDHDTSGFDDLEGTPAVNYLGALSYASQKGIILGYGNKKFGPTDGITYQDALTMIVRTLGYYNLSWPWGNIEKAVTLGLTKGIPSSVKYTDILNRGEVAQILYNALTATTKDGDTLAARNFNGDLGWQTIIITVAGKGYFTTDDDATLGVPSTKLISGDKKIGFKVVNADGTLSAQTYWVKNLQTFNFGDRLENYLGYAYKALFTKDEDSNLVTMEMCKPLVEDTVWNWGVTDGNYPITSFLSDSKLVSKYSNNTYLNEWYGNYGWYEFIMKNAIQGDTITVKVGNKYGIDWQNGNIVMRIADKTKADYTVMIDGEEAYFKIEWSWNTKLNTYFHYVYDEVNGTPEVVGIDILDEKDIANMKNDPYFTTKKVALTRGLADILDKDVTKTAYASLIPFTILDAARPNYGLFEEYRFGRFYEVKDTCGAHDGDQKGFEIKALNAVSEAAATLFSAKGYDAADFMNLYNENWAPYTLYTGIYEGSCDHGHYWINDERGLVPGNSDFVIYSVDECTGEIKVVKIIYDITDEKHDDKNFVATGIVRAYNVPGRTVTIGDKVYSFDYNALKGNGLLLSDPSKLELRAEFTYLFKSLFNQYVKYVICDGKIVYITAAGSSSDLIVVDSYAGLSSDGYIVINGYDTKNLEYRQYRIGSYNGWVKGDYYYYPGQAAVDAAFVRGTIYTINSYNGNEDVYYVSTVAQRNMTAKGLMYDLDELIEKGVLSSKATTTVTLNAGYKSFGGDYAKAGSKDKYILICNPIANWYGTFGGVSTTNGVDLPGYPHDLDEDALNGVAGGDYAPIIVYVGKGGDNWTVTGNAVKKTDDTLILINVDYTTINGFNKDQYDISYVLFLTYEYETAAYDGAGADGWYLLGASTYTAQCFDVYTGTVKPYIAVNKDLKRGYAYPAINGHIVNDIPYDAVRLNYAVPGAYESGSKYIFGHGTINEVLDGTTPILWDKDKVSKKILSYNPKLVPAGVGEVKGLTGGTSVFFVYTSDGAYGSTKMEVEKITDKQFTEWAADKDLATVYFWYVHTVGGNTVFYIMVDGDVLKTFDDTIKADNALVVKTGNTPYDEDTALINATANVTKTTRNDVLEALTIKSLVFEFNDNTKDAHGFTITGEDHNAIYLDSFEFGDNHECTKNDWNTAVTYDGDTANYLRVVGTLETKPYDPHAEEGGCEMIKAVKVVLPDGGKKIAFPTAAAPAATTTTINANFKDIDRDGNEEVYNFNVTVTVTCTFNADGSIKTTDVKFVFTDVANQLAGDNAVIELQ